MIFQGAYDPKQRLGITIYSGWGVVRRYTFPEGTSCTLNSVKRFNLKHQISHLDTLREESSSVLLFHSRHLNLFCQTRGENCSLIFLNLWGTYHHAAAASLPVNRCGHLDLNHKLKIAFWFNSLEKIWTLRVAVSWRLSITRRISSKFRPFQEMVQVQEEELYFWFVQRAFLPVPTQQI